MIAKPDQKKPIRHFTNEQRRKIVMETLRPGISVNTIARKHGINDSVIYEWRKKFLPPTNTSDNV